MQAYDGTGEQATVTILPDEADRDETKFDDAVVGLALDESLLVAGPATRGADGAQTRPGARRDRQRAERWATGTG